MAAYLATHRLKPSYRSLAVKHLWDVACATNRFGQREAHQPRDESLFRVPTYYGSAQTPDGQPLAREEFDEPNVAVLVREDDGIRVTLGSQDAEDLRFPDVQIERRPSGWSIFLHPIGGSDACGYVYFLDDGRSFVQPESSYCATPPIQVISSRERCQEIDTVPE